MVLQERQEPRDTFVHRRGNFLDRGTAVEPGTPEVLHDLTARGSVADRLDFAHWLVDRANPLTARVIVNRYWQRFFGRGIVETENDFGIQGTPPTHPQLLDWLAVEFMTTGWDVKSMHRLIVMSATYRQSSRHRAELVRADPSNRWFARQSRVAARSRDDSRLLLGSQRVAYAQARRGECSPSSAHGGICLYTRSQPLEHGARRGSLPPRDVYVLVAFESVSPR